MNSILKQKAIFYHTFNLNVVSISNHRNFFNSEENNLLKAPNHLSKQWQNIRQTTEDLEALSWREATGVGVILGFDNLIAIDIDGVTDFSLMKSILNFLSIPLNYKWIIQSGSKCGYHIILKCNNISFITESEIDTLKKTKYAYGNGSEHSPTFGSIDTNAYYPPKNNRSFNKIEFKWKGNLVLPPSIHVSGNIYSFVNGDPETSPIQIDFNKLFQLKEKYCSLQAEHSEQDGLEIEIPDEMGGEQTIEIKGHITQFVAKSDENDYNYYKKRNESAIIISSCAIRITGMDAVINKSDKVRALIQLSWLILDINNNVLKRKTYNYYKDNYTEDSFENYIAYGLANKIIQSKRAIYHELIFDIGHVCKIISHNLESLLFIKKEIKNSGLYLDSFIDNMPDEIQNQTLNKVIPDEKETIFISTECKTDIYKDYRKIFEIEYEGVLNSLTKLQLMLKIFLKKNNILTEIQNHQFEEQEDLSILPPIPGEKDSSYDLDDTYPDYEVPKYTKYDGTYGYDDNTIDNAFDGDPENYWNID